MSVPSFCVKMRTKLRLAFQIAPESTPEQGYRRLLDAADDYITIHQGE